jgi:hypothetical protein
MMNDSEFDKEHGQRGRTEREVERSVPCTAVHQIAEWLQEVEGALEDGAKRPLTQFERICVAVLRDNRDRLRSILDAINETQGEGTKPNA